MHSPLWKVHNMKRLTCELLVSPNPINLSSKGGLSALATYNGSYLCVWDVWMQMKNRLSGACDDPQLIRSPSPEYVFVHLVGDRQGFFGWFLFPSLLELWGLLVYLVDGLKERKGTHTCHIIRGGLAHWKNTLMWRWVFFTIWPITPILHFKGQFLKSTIVNLPIHQNTFKIILPF